MTETEAIQSLSAIGETAATYGALYFSVTFAYVTVAYLVGNRLSRFQSITATITYTLAATVFGLTALIYSKAWFLLKAKQPTIFDDIWFLSDAGWIEGVAVMLLTISLLSVYFMFDVRKDNRAE